VSPGPADTMYAHAHPDTGHRNLVRVQMYPQAHLHGMRSCGKQGFPLVVARAQTSVRRLTAPRRLLPCRRNLPRHAPCQSQQEGGKGRCPVVSNWPLHHAMQQRCHHASASARSPSWPPMPRPCLQRAAIARQEKFQLCRSQHVCSSPCPVPLTR
jgi:hypothetical protein